MKKLLASAAVIFGIAGFAAGPAQAAPQLGLYLTMDGSGSIDTTEFAAQVTAYNNALNSVFSSNPSLFGQVAISAGIFGADFAEFFAVQEITNSTILGNLMSAISGLIPGRAGINTGSTAIGDAITASATSLLTYETNLGSALKLIIDVTTDGQNNTGSDPATVAGNLTPSPIDAINCLGIGGGANCSFVTTSGAGTAFGAADFAGLEAALTEKLEIETGTVPEPATLGLVGLGLVGMGLAARRRKAA